MLRFEMKIWRQAISRQKTGLWLANPELVNQSDASLQDENLNQHKL